MLLFDGQAKTKNRQDVGAYTIPTLVEADLCLAGLQYLEQVGKRTDCLHSQVNRRISTSFTTDLPKTVRESLAKTGLQRPYDFRHFYACYLLESFVQCPGRPPVSSRVFLSRLLGHGSNDIHTANSYDSMCIRLTLSPEEQEEFTALWYKIFSC
jgi:integrase